MKARTIMRRKSDPSMKGLRTVSRVPPQTYSNPDPQLEMKFSDDSSIFSGLVDQENEINNMNGPPMEIRQPKGILRASTHAGPIHDLKHSSGESSSLFSQQSGSTLTLTHMSERSKMREMPPMVDSESTTTESKKSANSKMSTNSSSRMGADTFRDGDTYTQMTWGSANNMKRPKGMVKLVSAVQFLGDENNDDQFINECGSSDSDSRIVEILDDFERQMDANIQSLSEDCDENDVLTDFNKNIAPQNSDVPSQESQLGHFLTPHKARKLQGILHKARKEVEILRDNNEQYKSEIEQMEEEHKSEIKLVEDRAKQKLVELKNMYQKEIDDIYQEKDAAVVEAGRVAARYAENGKKQVSSMQKKVNKLKATAAMAIRERIKEERESSTKTKDKEISEKLDALRNLHESELEKMKIDSDERVKREVEKAVSSVAKRVRLNQDVLISELNTQIDEFKKQRHSTIEVLESVKSKFTKHYPDQMIEFNERSLDFSESTRGALGVNGSVDRGAEKALKEVIEIFSFLLEGAETKVALAEEQSALEENEKDSMEQLVHRQEAEIEYLKKEKEEKNERLMKLEDDFKALSREKCLLIEKYQTESESHRLEFERLSVEKETFMNVERSRKDLEHAMAEGQRELDHQKVRTEDGRFYTSSPGHSFSPPPSIGGTSAAIGRLLVDMSQTPPSIEKARLFQENHPKYLPRSSKRDSLGHQSSEHLSSKSVNDLSDGRRRTSTNGLYDTETSDCRSVTSNCSVQSNGTLSDLRNQVKEAEDQVMDIINDMSDSTHTLSDSTLKSAISSDKSFKSKDTILSNFRNQSKKSKDKDVVEVEEQGVLPEKKDSSKLSVEDKMKLSKTESGPRRRKLASIRRNVQIKKAKQEDNPNALRRKSMFKQVIELSKQDDSTLPSRKSLESISSLQTNNGVLNKDLIIASRQSKSSSVTSDGNDRIVHNISHDASNTLTNTLGMFSQESMMSEIVSEVESKDDIHIKPPKTIHDAYKYEEKLQSLENEDSKPFRETSSNLNFKKPLPPTDDSAKSKDLSGKKGTVTTEVLSGKKSDPTSRTRDDSIYSETDNSIPSSIALRPQANKSITAVANGHTLLCKPLSVQQSKIYPQETVSNLSGGTVSFNEDEELVSDSHVRMRELPPLTDDSDGEDSDRSERDKYRTVRPSISEDSSSSTDQKSVATLEEKISSYHRSGLAAFKPAQSYESGLKNSTTDTNSTAGSSVSQATTAVTAHTRKSLSFLREPRRNRIGAFRQSTALNKGSSNGTKRFAALKARVRVRKV